jgi:hypothetical protein
MRSRYGEDKAVAGIQGSQAAERWINSFLVEEVQKAV